MSFSLTKSREAVTRAERATRVLLVIAVALMVALGSSFALLVMRQNTLQQSIREDILWAAYQLDREARTLSDTLDHQKLPDLELRPNAKDLTQKYDILYSRLSILDQSKYGTLFDGNLAFDERRAAARQRILYLEPFFNKLAQSGVIDLAMLQDAIAGLKDLQSITNNLLLSTNAAVTAARADERSDVMALQHTAALVVVILGITIGLLILNLTRQIRIVGAASREMENTATALSEAYEAAEAGNRAKSEFMATIGHEIRTPLNAILGMAELLSLSRLGSEERESVEVITSSGTALLEMINEILDFAKLESGKMTVEMVAFDPKELVSELTRVVLGRIRERNNRIEIVDELVERSSYLGDPTLLKRVILNLLSNASKFTENGIIRAVVRKAESVDGLRFEVVDTGIGIPQAAKERLFKAFSQVDGSISRRFGGTGLGLAICKRIIDEMGGTIGVESTPGVGSRFWFEIPATRAEAPAYVSPDHAAEQAARPLRILVVEDNAINRDVARKFLQKLRQDIETANDGAEGVARALAKPFDLILMDMQMPVMDGIAAAKALRAAGNVTPIVALTANASDRDRALCAEAGMNGFEAKPVSMRRLSALLKNYSSGVVADPGKAIGNARETDQLRDEHRVRDLVDALGEEGLKELTSSFLSDGPSLLSELSAALEGNDAARLDRALHSIKGASSNLGFVRLALLAESLRHQPPDKEMVKVISNELALIDSSLSAKAA